MDKRKLEIVLELEKRGALPEDKKVILAELRKRGLVEGGSPQNTGGGTMEPVPDWGVRNPRLYGLYGAAKETGKEAGKLALEGTMMGVGSMGGGLMTGGNPIGIATGGGLGYSGAKMIEEKLAGNKDARIKGEDFLMGAAMEGGVAAGKAGANLVKKHFTPSAEDFKLKELYKKFGVTPLPSEERAIGSKSLGILESVLGYTPFSGDVMIKHATKQMDRYNEIYQTLIERGASQKQLENVGNSIRKEAKIIIERYEGKGYEYTDDLVEDFMQKFAGDYTKYSGGTSVKEVLAKDLSDRKENIDKLYTKVKEKLGSNINVQHEISEETVAVAKGLLEEELAKAPAQRNAGIVRALMDFVPKTKKVDDSILESMELMSDKVKQQIMDMIGAGETTVPKYSYMGLDKTRSEMLDKASNIYKATGGRGDSISRVYTALADAIDKDMAKIAGKYGDDIRNAHLAAREAAKTSFEIYDKDVLGIMNMKAEKVVDKITNGGVDVLKNMMEPLGNSGKGVIQTTYMRGLFNKALKNNGQLDVAKIRREYGRMLPEIRDMIFTKEQQGSIEKMMDKADTINTRFFVNKEEAFEFFEVISNMKVERVIDYMLKKDNARYIGYAKRFLSEERLKEIQEQALIKVFKSTPEGNLLPVSSAIEFKKYETPLRKLLPENVYNDVSDFLKMAQHSKKIEALAKNASQTGQVFVGYQILQGLLKYPAGVAKTTGVPWAIAKIYVNPQARAFLKKALVAPDKEATGWFVRALAVAGADLVDDTVGYDESYQNR